MQCDGDRLLIPGTLSLLLVDVSDPANPSLLSMLAGGDTDWAAFAANDLVIARVNDQLRTYGISSPTTPQLLATGSTTPTGSAPLVVGSLAYLASRDGLVGLLDVSTLEPWATWVATGPWPTSCPPTAVPPSAPPASPMRARRRSRRPAKSTSPAPKICRRPAGGRGNLRVPAADSRRRARRQGRPGEVEGGRGNEG
jgi:hypothetical protein